MFEYIFGQIIQCKYFIDNETEPCKNGNLIFRKTARNFNQDMATAGKIVIA